MICVLLKHSTCTVPTRPTRAPRLNSYRIRLYTNTCRASGGFQLQLASIRLDDSAYAAFEHVLIGHAIERKVLLVTLAQQRRRLPSLRRAEDLDKVVEAFRIHSKVKVTQA